MLGLILCILILPIGMISGMILFKKVPFPTTRIVISSMEKFPLLFLPETRKRIYQIYLILYLTNLFNRMKLSLLMIIHKIRLNISLKNMVSLPLQHLLCQRVGQGKIGPFGMVIYDQAEIFYFFLMPIFNLLKTPYNLLYQHKRDRVVFYLLSLITGQKNFMKNLQWC